MVGAAGVDKERSAEEPCGVGRRAATPEKITAANGSDQSEKAVTPEGNKNT